MPAQDDGTSHLSPPNRCLSADVAELERLLAEKRAAKARRTRQQIVPVPRDGPLLCTFQQESNWLDIQRRPPSAAYHLAVALQLTGPLVAAALQRALHALVVRHEALRTRFIDNDGLPRQVIDPPPTDFPLPVSDVDPDQVQAWAAEHVGRPMDLAHGPLFRAALARTGPDRHVLAVVVHHLVSDGWSIRILASELSHIYTAGTAAALVPLPIQAADHAAWERRWLQGAELDRQLGYWRNVMAGMPAVDFPTDRPRPAQLTARGAAATRWLPDKVAELAHGYARTNQISFLAIMQAALLPVLHRWTGQYDLPIASLFTGRTRAEIEPLVGDFANTLILRTSLDGNPTWAELIRRCHNTVLDVTMHQDFPLCLIVNTPERERADGRYLYQFGLSVQPPGASPGDLELNGVTAEVLPLDLPINHLDIDIHMAQAPDGRLHIAADYSPELFDADRIERLLDHLTAALAYGLDAPGQPALDIELMTTAECHRDIYISPTDCPLT